MASSKQTEDGRRAYTLCAAALLGAYPEKAPGLLFSDDPSSSKPIAYLFIKMVQVDIVSTLHVLVPKLSTPEYPSISRRIAAALDVTTSFVGFLINAGDDSTTQQGLTPDRLIKLHEDLVRTIGDVMEYLHDRWDAYLMGTRGIEPAQSSGMSIFEDPITPATIRLIAIWLRDDDGETLRKQAAGLIDLFAELYKMNLAWTDMPELHLPILAALEGILQISEGREAFTTHDIWSRCLYPDLRAILINKDADLTAVDYVRGSAIVHTFHIFMENDENQHSYPDSKELLESITKYEIRKIQAGTNDLDQALIGFQTDVLELAATLLDTSSRDAPLAYQQMTSQQIKITLKDAASKVMENWRVLNDESMAARMAELQFD
jgi:hypothetical protein